MSCNCDHVDSGVVLCLRFICGLLRCGLLLGRNISSLLNQCYVFSGGNCDLTCEAPTKCEFSCTSGDCDSTVCKADTCDQSCTGGGCSLECHGTTCKQSCTRGNCALKCSDKAETCEQSCTVNKDGCTIEYVDFTTEAPGIQCDGVVEDGVCIQSCTGGGCSLKCLNSSEYHSCEQSCTGKFQNAFCSCFSCRTPFRGGGGRGSNS